MNRHRIHTKAGAGDFQPFFDWQEPEPPPAIADVPEDLSERIGAACEDWMRRGGLIVRGTFGVSTVNRKRERLGRDEKGNTLWGGISGTYRTHKHCCPLAPLLDGLPSRFNPVADFALVLGVDHLWVLGFIHGVDKEVFMVGRRQEYLEESLSYVDGRALGVKIGERYVIVRGGWEIPDEEREQ